MGDAEPVAHPRVAFGVWQEIAPVDERGAPALADQRFGAFDDEPPRQRPLPGLQREIDRRITISGGVQARRGMLATGRELARLEMLR